MIEDQQNSDSTLEPILEDQVFFEKFYAGAGRGPLLAQIENALENGVPLMVISGGEGNGKTVMCRILEKKCPSAVAAVYFPNPVNSFEDVVRIVAKKLGLGLSATVGGKIIDEAIAQIIEHLRQQSKGLLVIFDEAEDIYLATLERIRKMLDRVTAAGVRMQVIFSGRKVFLENIEQLSICDFRNNENLHFELLPLTEFETAEYLHYRSEILQNEGTSNVFSDEVIKNIHSSAKGNFQRINFLADESLRSHAADTSFVLLGDSVEEEAEEEVEQRDRNILRRASPYLWWIGGTLCTLFVLFFLLRPGEERHSVKTAGTIAEKVKVEAVAQDGKGGQHSTPKPVSAEATKPPIQEPATLQKESEVVEQKLPETTEKDAGLMTTSAGSTEKQQIPEQPLAPQQTVVHSETESTPTPVPTNVVTAAAAKVPELRHIPALKTKHKLPSEPTAGIAKQHAKAEAPDAATAGAHLTPDQLYQKRLNAGAGWASGQKNDKFTVQLMVLTAKDAEPNLKKMLAQPNYRQEAGNFFIFKKNGPPVVLFVFYGEYPTMEMAKLAQNSLPQFLHAQQSYAISIKGAMAKVGK
jgi:type II secretory pathway predicted ATPase ExeA